MGFSERIELLIDVTTKGASSALGSLKRDLSDTDDAFGKTESTSSKLWTGIKQHAGTAALGAATAIASFAVKAVGDFQDVALASGKMSDALGISTVEASRLIEVAGDLGVSASSVEGAFAKMNLAAARTPEAFSAIGAAIAKNKDGTIDVVKTFENASEAISKIPDAAQRADAAQKIFGKGWKEIAELITSGADGIQAAMAGVESAKVISPAEVEQARKFRDMMDQLQGILESFTLTVGSKVVPVLLDLRDGFEVIGDAWRAVDGAFNSAEGAIGRFVGTADDDITVVIDKFDELAIAAEAMQGAIETGGSEIRLIGERMRGLDGELNTAATGFAGVDYAVEGADGKFKALDGTLVGMATGFGGVDAGFDDMVSGSNDTSAATAELTRHLEAQRAALQEQADAARGSVDANFALRDSQRDAEEAAKNVNDVIEDQESTMQDLAAALDDSSQAAIEVADNQVRVAEETAKASNQTLTAAQRADAFNSSLINQASTLKGPARDALLTHIAQLNGIPEEEATAIRAAVAAGDIPLAEKLLAHASRTREAEIRAEAVNGDATARYLDWVARTRNVNLNVVTNGLSLRAGGGTVGPNEPVTMVGEEGPELVSLPSGSMVHTASQTASILAGRSNGTPVSFGGSGGATTVNVTIVMPKGASGADVVSEIRKYERYNGKGWWRAS